MPNHAVLLLAEAHRAELVRAHYNQNRRLCLHHIHRLTIIGA